MPQNRTLKEIALELLRKYETAQSAANDELCYDPFIAEEELYKDVDRYLAEIEAAEKAEIDSLTQRSKAAMDCTHKPTPQRPNQ